MSKRTIAVFTGNRAEYGLQFPILKAIDAHPDLDYRLIVSGAHLDTDFGRTLAEIEADGFTVHAEVKCDLETDTLYATAQAVGTFICVPATTAARPSNRSAYTTSKFGRRRSSAWLIDTTPVPIACAVA